MTKPTYRERPILFKGEMVRAILDGRKTQTRRSVKSKVVPLVELSAGANRGTPAISMHAGELPCPYGSVGDRLWVRETWNGNQEVGLAYRATNPEMNGAPWRPSIHMPRWASRITLEITKVRVERLQEISEEDAKAEGCRMDGAFPKEQPDKSGIGSIGWDDAKEWYSWLWEEINGPGSWDKSPWVWVLEFRVITP